MMIDAIELCILVTLTLIQGQQKGKCIGFKYRHISPLIIWMKLDVASKQSKLSILNLCRVTAHFTVHYKNNNNKPISGAAFHIKHA